MADFGSGAFGVVVFAVVFLVARQSLWLSAMLAAGAYLGLKLLFAPKPSLKLENLARRWESSEEGAHLAIILRLLKQLPQAPERAYLEQACTCFAYGAPPTGAARTALLELLTTVEQRLTRRLAGELHDDDRAQASELMALRQTLIELEPERRQEIKQ